MPKPLDFSGPVVFLRSLHLREVKLVPPLASILFEQLLESSCKELVEVKLEHLDLSSQQNVLVLCNFLSAQVKLINLSLKDCGFKLAEVNMLLQAILDAELTLTL